MDSLGTEGLFLLVAVAVIGVALGVLLVRVSARSQRTLDAGLKGIEKQLQEKLDSSKESMDQSLKQAAHSTSESLSALQNSVGQIKGHQGQIDKLSGNMAEVHKVLVATKRQGVFGERVLEDIVKDALPPELFQFQKQIQGRVKPDLLIKYPPPNSPLCVDAKFPATSYLNLVNADSEEVKSVAIKEFEDAMKKHIKDVSKRYIIQGETAEHALMFIPSESIFLDVHVDHPKLVQLATDSGVYLVSPNTFMSVLTTIASIHRDYRTSEDIDEIVKNVGKLESEVNKLIERTRTARRQFDSSSNALEEVEKRAGNAEKLSKTIREIRPETFEEGSAVAQTSNGGPLEQ